MFPQEKEVQPGIYLSEPQASLEDNVEFLREEIVRLTRSVEMLLSSNHELNTYDPNDPDFAEAIKENKSVIAKQRHLISKYENRVKEITGSVPEKHIVRNTATITLPEREENMTENIDDTEGIYL